MDEARLAEIEALEWGLDSLEDVIAELIAEVRRLQKLSQATDRAYNDGQNSGHADIVGILLDPQHPDDDTKVLAEIKQFLGC